MAYKFQLGAARLSGSVVQEGAISADGGAVSGSGNLNIGGNAEIAGTVKLAGIAEAVLDVNADFLYFQDADGTMKKEATGDYAAAMAGVGIGVDSGVLKLDLGELSTAAVADGDFFGFIDATDGSNKKDAVADLATLFAGAGLTAASSVIALDIDDLNALGGTGLHQTQDHFVFSDNGTEKKITFSNLEDAIFANVSGDATIAAGGALTIAAGAVEGSMVADDLISAQSNLGGTGVAQADEFLFSDAGTLKAITFSNLEDAIFGNVSGDAAIAAGGALTIASNAVENGMMADDSVGADELIDGAIVNAAVSNSAAIAATKLDFNVDLGGNVTFGTQADDTVSFSGPVTVGGDLIVNGTTTSVNSTTINISSSFTFEGPADAHETILSCATPAADTTLNLPTLSAGTFYIPALADAATDASAAVTAAEFALLDGASTIGTTALASGDGFLHNDGGTMKQTSIDKIADLFAGSGLAASSGVMELDIDGLSALGGASIAQADLLVIDDGANGTNKKVTFSNLEDSIFGNVSGDATIAAGGALTIAAGAVENAMLADDAVGADELAANAVVNASVVDGSIKADKLDIDGSTDIGEALVNADLFIVDNGAGGTNRKCTMSRLKTYIGSGTAAVALKAAADTLAVGINYFADMSSDGEDAVTLPASAGMTVGESVKVKAPSDCSAARYITINKAGSQTIDGATSIRLESPFAAVELVYVAADTWRVF